VRNGPASSMVTSKVKMKELEMESKTSNMKAVKETYEDPPIHSESPSKPAMESRTEPD
jgi:hypothetical protein